MIARAVRGTGELLITAGLVVLLFVAYELWGTGVHTARAQNAADNRMTAAWAAGDVLPGEPDVPDSPVVSADPTAKPVPGRSSAPAPSAAPSAAADIPLGTGLARLRIPRFGAGYQWVVGEGVTVANLKNGPGHYPHTALPGQIGNFVVSGHRTTYGAPFGGVAELQPGDAIVVETAKAWYTYRVRSHDIVSPTRVSVTLPVPGDPGAEPVEALMTMTTCHPKFSARQRYIVYSALESAIAKSAGVRPPALGGG
ncbi:MAG: sortase [Frankiaceae bacterium]|nr:sortase [Frankiaceae bacterium]